MKMKKITSIDIARTILDENTRLPITQQDYKKLATDFLILHPEDYS